MDMFKSWILSVCGASTITSLCKILLSKSKIRKTSGIFLSVFVLFYMILPNGNYNFHNNFENNEEHEESSFDLNYKDGYEKIVIESVKKICEENNVKIISYDIDSYIDEDGYLFVDYITIDIADNNKIPETESEIENKLGFEVNVV